MSEQVDAKKEGKKPSKSGSYKDSYQQLKEVAEYLPTLEEPDVDIIVEKVAVAMKAYKDCKSRIDKALTDLDQLLEPSKVNG